MTLPKPKILVVVPVERESRLAVQLLQSVKASNGQEFITGQVAGFTPESAVTLVIHDVGRAYCHDQAAGKEWARALIDIGRLEEEDDERLIGLMCGPFAVHVREQMKQIDEAQERGRARRATEEAAAKKAAEEKAAADALQLEKDKAEAEVKAKEAAELKALQEANEKKLAEEAAALAADGLVKATADVSNPDVSADAMGDKQPAPTPAPEPTSRRGNRTPRS